MRAIWLTDPHLNFLPDDEIDSFLDRVQSQHADVTLISGDFGESNSVLGYLRRIDERLDNFPPHYLSTTPPDQIADDLRSVHYLEQGELRLAGKYGPTVTGSMAFAANHVVANPHPDSDPRDIGAALSALLGPLPNALGRNSLAVPGFEPKDPIGFGNYVPAFEVGEPLAPLISGPDMLGPQFR